MTGQRDRDNAGRPRNARPRDGLGRPLARDAAGVPVTVDDLELTPGQAVLIAQRLIDEGRPFHAHEVLEAAWKAAPDGQRDAWKGLAQIAVGLTHARRGNATGAVALLRRGAAAISGAAISPGTAREASLPEPLDLPAASRAAAALADQIAAAGLRPLGDDELRLKLTR